MRLLITTLLLLNSLSANARTIEEARELLLQIEDRIRSDISYSFWELVPSKKKQEFINYYRQEVEPRHEHPIDHILDKAIHPGERIIVFWTEGISPSAWGGKEWLYVVSIDENDKLTIETSKELERISRGAEEYHASYYWPSPNEGCGYNDFVLGLLTYLNIGSSGSSVYRQLITYNRYDREFEIDEDSSPVMMQPVGC